MRLNESHVGGGSRHVISCRNNHAPRGVAETEGRQRGADEQTWEGERACPPADGATQVWVCDDSSFGMSIKIRIRRKDQDRAKELPGWLSGCLAVWLSAG